MQSFPLEEKNFLLPGPAGHLEILTVPLEGATQTAIICHPHPLYGGTMHNKVVTTLARAFRELGLRTVRFNFRGIGKSEGSYDEGNGETEDTLSIVDWIQSIFPKDGLWLAGFSFGGFIAAKTATRASVAQLVTIAPQVSRFKAEPLAPITCPWLLVQGEQDELVPPREVFAWAGSINPKPKVIPFPTAGHFFHGQLIELRKTLVTELSRSGLG